MNFRPLSDRLLVKRVENEEKTAGGIFIPDAAKEKPQQGLVVAAGPGKALDNGELRAMDVKAGDKIFFRKFAGTEITVAGEEHLILREDEVLAVIED